MGLLNLITKGVRVEKKAVPQPQVQAEITAEDLTPPPLTLEQPMFNQMPQHNSMSSAHQQLALHHPPPYQQHYMPYPAPQQDVMKSGTSIFFDSPHGVSAGFSSPTFMSEPASTNGGRNILVVVPKSNQDVTHIVQNLQNGEACVINLESIPHAEAQRRLDFLSGVICALGGTIRGLDQQKYILTPQGLGVRG